MTRPRRRFTALNADSGRQTYHRSWRAAYRATEETLPMTDVRDLGKWDRLPPRNPLHEAAPDLLAACEEVVRWVEEDTVIDLDELSDECRAMYERCLAAIAKARGEHPS